MISITRYRVWPDGDVQEADTPAHHWKSDDYELVEAPTPEDAWARAKANAPMVPELNYAAICDAAFLQDRRWAQGTTGCVAFAQGAEWYRDQLLAKGLHTLYKTNDPEAPATISDRNGEVILSLCKVCGKAAGELGEPCHAPAVPQGNDPAWTLAAKVLEALDSKACPDYYMDVAIEAVVHNYIYATTAPAPAQDFDLTDEEIEAIAQKHMSTVGDHWCNEEAIRERHAEDFARAIIAALRAKGGKL